MLHTTGIPLLLVALAVLSAVLLVSLATCAYIYRYLFVPNPARWQDDFLFTPWEFQADFEEVDLVSADGVRFGAWYFRQPGSPQTVVVSPGHKGQRQAVLGICIALWRKGFNVVTYSYRGMPGSDRRRVTLGIDEVNELQAAIAFARQRVKGARIGLLGYSMGAAVSLLGGAGEPSIAAFVLDSPFRDLRQLVRENIRRTAHLPAGPLVALVDLWFRLRSGRSMSEASPATILSALEPRPLFFIHGGADALTGVHHSRQLYDSYRGPREIWIVQGAPHTGAYFADRELYVERVAAFFGRHLGLSRANQLRLIEEEEVS
ncbi:MAG: alpha/beta fold hydrolase [Candidatus Dormibacteraeota bacterium]|nr:alpha/beta fold hydrolase [Candidatus Dormibacteraeota bacterium]